ncbi:MAG: preprotein translocase subunit SecE [Thermoleophilia bacterium]
MAKPAKVKKDQDAAPAKKGAKKAAPKGKVKEASAKGKVGKAKEKKGAVQFLREVRVEMGKVTWPSREELIQSTIVVLIAVAISGVFIAILDAIFSRLVGLVS